MAPAASAPISNAARPAPFAEAKVGTAVVATLAGTEVAVDLRAVVMPPAGKLPGAETPEAAGEPAGIVASGATK